MILSDTNRFVFIKTKKTAGTSIEVFLSDRLGRDAVVTPVGREEATESHRARNYNGLFSPVRESVELVGAPAEWKQTTGGGALQTWGHFVKSKRFYNHIPAFRAANRMGWARWERYFTFAVERNPWDKALSQYYWKARHRSDYTFEQFVREGDVGVNYPRYCHPATGEVMVNRIVYYHRLNQELVEVFGRVGVPFSGELEVRAKGSARSNREPYQDAFTGRLAKYRDDIDRLFAREIELHGWDFESGSALGIPGRSE